MTSTAGRILGNYELGEPIGRGGASEVFAAVHRFLGHEVAVKLLRADLPGEAAPSSVEAFLGEAARARAVHHPNLVSVLDFGRDEATGRCYLVMERIPGESLAERLRRVGRLPEPEVRALGAALADAMQAAHDGGIVHRDLKPANVMLRGDQPTVVDFGLARDLGGQSALETGRRVGTPAYMAPEQLTGGLIAPCVDIWSLGVILFEAVTGVLPFEGFTDGRCPQLFESAPRVASLVEVAPALDALVAACLERSPGRRPATMASVARALRGEGDERVTQDVAQPVLGGAPGPPGSSRPTAAAGPIGAPGMGGAHAPGGAPAMRSAQAELLGLAGDPSARPLDPAARPGDPATRPGDPSARPGDPAAATPPTRLAPATRATRIGALLARRRHWAVVGLAAAAASVAALVTVRVVGARSATDSASATGAAGSSRPAPTPRLLPGEPVGSPPASQQEAARGRADAPTQAVEAARGRADVPRRTAEAAAPASAAEPANPAVTSLAIEVRSTPPGAEVLVGGERRGRTPVHLELPGPGRVLLRKRGYRPAAVRVERAGLLDVHLTRRGRSKPARRPARPPEPARGEGLD